MTDSTPCYNRFQLEIISGLFKGLSDSLSLTISSLLKKNITIRFQELHQGTFLEMLKQTTPFFLNFARVNMSGSAALGYESSFLLAVLDTLLGAGNDEIEIGSDEKKNRHLTPLELRLTNKISTSVWICLEELLRVHTAENVSIHGGVCTLEHFPESECHISEDAATEEYPEDSGMIPCKAPVAAVRMEVLGLRYPEYFSFFLPYATFSAFIPEQSPDRTETETEVEPPNRKEVITGNVPDETEKVLGSNVNIPKTQVDSLRERMGEAIRRAVVNVCVQLPPIKISATEMLGWHEGDVLNTRLDVGTPLEINVEGKAVYLGCLGMYKHHKAVQIKDVP